MYNNLRYIYIYYYLQFTFSNYIFSTFLVYLKNSQAGLNFWKI